MVRRHDEYRVSLDGGEGGGAASASCSGAWMPIGEPCTTLSGAVSPTDGEPMLSCVPSARSSMIPRNVQQCSLAGGATGGGGGETLLICGSIFHWVWKYLSPVASSAPPQGEPQTVRGHTVDADPNTQGRPDAAEGVADAAEGGRCGRGASSCPWCEVRTRSDAEKVKVHCILRPFRRSTPAVAAALAVGLHRFEVEGVLAGADRGRAAGAELASGAILVVAPYLRGRAVERAASAAFIVGAVVEYLVHSAVGCEQTSARRHSECTHTMQEHVPVRGVG